MESDETPNTVLEQSPDAGSSVEEYSRVTIKYSKGSSGVTIPELTKFTKDDATKKLEALGLPFHQHQKNTVIRLIRDLCVARILLWAQV